MRPRRVLLIEDDPHYSDLLSQLLTSAGYAVSLLESAFGARAEAARWCPHVIMLDLGLPYRSGLSLLADLRADPLTASIPIVVVSGQLELLRPDVREMVSAALPKPLELRALLDAVRTASDSARARRCASSPAT